MGRWPALPLLLELSRRFRRRRLARMFALLHITENTRVLDVGGTPSIWALAPVMPRLVLLNHPRAAPEFGSAVPVVFGDGLALPFADRSFDLVFTNSVLEHVGGSAEQAAFAREIARVGRAFWVQTPDRAFPLEQHLWMPLLHWFPKSWQARLLAARITPWEWVVSPAEDERRFYIEHYLAVVRLLNRRQLSLLFPGARILRERLLGWPKSLVAVSVPRANGRPRTPMRGKLL